jgi:hypothetical protein
LKQQKQKLNLPLANPSAQLPACPPSPSSSPEVFKLPSLPFLGAIVYFYDYLEQKNYKKYNSKSQST